MIKSAFKYPTRSSLVITNVSSFKLRVTNVHTFEIRNTGKILPTLKLGALSKSMPGPRNWSTRQLSSFRLSSDGTPKKVNQ